MYCTVTDLEKLLPRARLMELADDGGEGPTPEDVLQEAIDQADGEIDAYLGLVMTVPVDPAPRLLTNLSAKIAVYNLHRRLPHLELGEWGKEYERAVKLLERMAKGEISLGTVGGEEGSEVVPPGDCVTVTRPPLMDMEGF